MLTKNINFKNFKFIKNNKKIKKDLNIILQEKNSTIESLRASYKNSYSKKIVKKYKKHSSLKIIGMGGSILGTEAIYNFLNKKIKKEIYFYNNLQAKLDIKKKKINT
ncbi:hypothetical protein ABXT63_05955 [Candidatus Pelagibacter sp. Uisw_092]|uniref:hypothetical protein n=1 Tax=Candidatus Pelagibacter sp. Uisw_092 TaxID=3230979 RepID=UPI0039E92556